MGIDIELLDTPEATKFLHMPSPRTLERWRYHRTGPPYIQLNHSRVRYRKSDLIAWLDAHTITPGRASAAA